ncbi:MAG TPA: LysR family transcriptional regulator [Polyangiaceae bacterium]|nr:LysR family transcriptional regulator [Polyangiaceae bacterium]
MRSLVGLQAFLAVAARGGFTGAAASLGVSPSAVSQAVRRLEGELGVALLARTTRSVGLTEAGRRLVGRAGPALRQAVSALDEAGAEGGVAGLLRLNVPSIALDAVVGPALPGLVAAHPRLKIEISVDNRLVDVVAGGYDAGIRLGEAIERDMVAARLTAPFRFVVVGAPSYLDARGRPSSPRALRRHRCVVFRAPSTGALLRWDLERQGRSYDVAVEGPIISDSAELMLRAARDGLGLAYLYEPMAAADIARGALEIVLEEYAPEVPGFFLYFPRSARQEPKLRAFLAHARRAAAPD